MMKEYYESKENGNLVTWNEMMAEMAEFYDGDDSTNILDWSEYYTYCGKMDLGN